MAKNGHHLHKEVSHLKGKLHLLSERLEELEAQNKELHIIIRQLQDSYRTLHDKVEDIQKGVVENYFPDNFVKASFLEKIFRGSGFKIKEPFNVPPPPKNFIITAKLIGKWITNLSVQDLLSAFKRAVCGGDTHFELYLESYTPEAISAVNQLLVYFDRIGLIKWYHYNKKYRILRGEVNKEHHEGINFITGKWLEIWLYEYFIHKLREIFPVKQIRLFQNVRIQHQSSGKDYELDGILWLDGDIYWIECTTGDYAKDLKKMQELCALLPFKKCILVLDNVDQSIAQAIEVQHDIYVLRVENYAYDIRRIVTV